jgi:predicted O-linked N-acetylglucosamine transferase (SPINDLY family)
MSRTDIFEPLVGASAEPSGDSIGAAYQRQQASQAAARHERWRQTVRRGYQEIARAGAGDQLYLDIVDGHRRLGEYEEAAILLRRRVSESASRPIVEALVAVLERSNRTEEAIAEADRGLKLFPQDTRLRFARELLLPIVYDTETDIERYRRRFSEGLERLCRELPLDGENDKREALRALSSHRNVRLPYQNRNDRELQTRYGRLAQRIMAANRPQWTPSVSMPPVDGCLRVGYLSTRFRNLSASKYFLGWIKGHDPAHFQVYSYHLSRKSDAVTDEVQRSSTCFRHLSGGFGQACSSILADRLHVLVSLDVGLDPVMTLLSSLRLAPVQCAAWDQPLTTGSPAIDYFLSSDLTEPEDAQSHYAERLVRLPGVAVCYPKPVIPTPILTKTRRDFRLRDDAVVFLCNQYVEKYLPRQDALFARIASRVPRAQFVFLMKNDPVRDDFQKRLSRSFAAAGLAASDHLVLEREVDQMTYWNLSLVGDVVLDPIGWSGGVSTFEAIACRVPIVTLPGQFMRGRQSAAMLTQLGITDTIARDDEDFVDIAVRLGTDRTWREDIVRRMTAGWPRLYNDGRSIRALEEFYQQAVVDA